MKERLIISIILILMAYAVCGCEDEPELIVGLDENGMCTISCPCGMTYILEEKEGRELYLSHTYTTFTLDPNEASYKGFFGWE